MSDRDLESEAYEQLASMTASYIKAKERDLALLKAIRAIRDVKQCPGIDEDRLNPDTEPLQLAIEICQGRRSFYAAEMANLAEGMNRLNGLIQNGAFGHE